MKTHVLLGALAATLSLAMAPGALADEPAAPVRVAQYYPSIAPPIGKEVPAATLRVPIGQKTAAPPREPAFVLGALVGMGFPQPFSELRNYGVYTVEAGYALPGWGRRVQLGASFSFSEPGSGGFLADPRFSGSGNFGYNLTQRQYVIDVGALVRFLPFGARLNGYGRVGARVYLLDSVVNGTAGTAPFGQYNERFTQPGFALGGGVELRLGPGAFTAELRLEYSALDKTLTGASNSGMLSLAVGYRFFL